MPVTDYPRSLDDLRKQWNLRLKARDARALSELAKEYTNVYRTAEREWQTVVAKIARAQRQGKEITTGWLFREAQLEQVMENIGQALAQFSGRAARNLSKHQREQVKDAVNFARQAAQTNLGTNIALGAAWSDIPETAVKEMVGRTSDGSPVTDVLSNLVPTGKARAREIIVNGVAQGQNPRKVASLLRQELGAQLSRAQTITRTEMMNAYRDATLASYRENDKLINGYMWTSAEDDRTCETCWALTGQFFPIEIDADAHINCRCSMVPEIGDWSDVGFGEEVEADIEDLPEDVQDVARSIIKGGGNIDFPSQTASLFYRTLPANRVKIESAGVIRTGRGKVEFNIRRSAKREVPGKEPPVTGVDIPMKIPLKRLRVSETRGAVEIPIPATTLTVREWIQTGPGKFAQLSDARKRIILGPSKYRAWKAGEIELRDMIGVKVDPRFGRSVYAKSLKEVLGPAKAKKFYTAPKPRPAPRPTPPSRTVTGRVKAPAGGVVMKDVKYDAVEAPGNWFRKMNLDWKGGNLHQVAWLQAETAKAISLMQGRYPSLLKRGRGRTAGGFGGMHSMSEDADIAIVVRYQDSAFMMCQVDLFDAPNGWVILLNDVSPRGAEMHSPKPNVTNTRFGVPADRVHQGRVIHELGHILSYQGGLNEEILSTFIRKAGLSKGEIKRYVSKYAASNSMEFFAEVVALKNVTGFKPYAPESVARKLDKFVALCNKEAKRRTGIGKVI